LIRCKSDLWTYTTTGT